MGKHAADDGVEFNSSDMGGISAITIYATYEDGRHAQIDVIPTSAYWSTFRKAGPDDATADLSLRLDMVSVKKAEVVNTQDPTTTGPTSPTQDTDN